MSYAKRNQGRGRRSPRLDQLARIERMVRELLRRSGVTMEMEFEQMADFSKMLESIRKTEGRVASTNKLVSELRAALDAAAADMNDEEDQKKIEELSAQLDAVASQLPEAIAANPAPGEPDIAPAPVGGSTGGIKPTE